MSFGIRFCLDAESEVEQQGEAPSGNSAYHFTPRSDAGEHDCHNSSHESESDRASAIKLAQIHRWLNGRQLREMSYIRSMV